MTPITPIQCNRSIASPDVEATPAAKAAVEGGKLGGIDGESTDASHKDWVEVLRVVSTNPADALSSFVATYGLHAAASTHDSGAKHFADFTFTKNMDGSSSRLGA